MKRKTLHINILQFVIILLLVTTGMISAIFYSNTSVIMEELTDKLIVNITNQIVLKNNHARASIQEQLLNLQYSLENVSSLEENIVFNILHQFTYLNKSINSVYVSDTLGTFYQYRYNEDEDVCRKVIVKDTLNIDIWKYYDTNYTCTRIDTVDLQYVSTTRPWYKETVKNRKVTFSDIYKFKTNGKLGITASIPILKNGVVVNVIGIDVTLSSIANYIDCKDISQNGFYIIVDNTERVVIDKSPIEESEILSKISDTKNRFTQLIYNESNVVQKDKFTVNYLKNSYYISKSTFGGANEDWSMFLVIPYNDILGSVYKLIHKVWVYVGVIFVLAFIFVLWFSKRVADPIEELAEQMKYIKLFELEKVTGVNSCIKEVNLMSQAVVAATVGLNSFKKYIPSALVQKLIKEGKEAELGGERKRVTIMFTDIEKFSKISEKLDPEDLTLYLSEYLDVMSKIIMKNDGTVNKYMGDGILAFWGAPTDIENNAELACRTALECQNMLLKFNSKSIKANKPMMATRIGIHTGEVIVGNFGTDEKFEYSIIGDCVNVTAGIEELNKKCNTSILISEDTYQEVKDIFNCNYISDFNVKGREQKVKLYELL